MPFRIVFIIRDSARYRQDPEAESNVLSKAAQVLPSQLLSVHNFLWKAVSAEDAWWAHIFPVNGVPSLPESDLPHKTVHG